MTWPSTTSLWKQRVAFLCSVLVLIPGLLTAPDPAEASKSSTCRGVQVRPDTDLQARIESKPRGTVFCFAKGLYLLSGTIWTGQKFPTLDLRAGAVIDGQNGGFIGINGPDAPADKPGTTILGGVFQHFGNAGAPSWVSPLIVRRNGVVKGTEFKENFNAGLAIQGSNARVSHVDTHHNGRYGLVVTPPCDGCPGPMGVIVEDSEIGRASCRERVWIPV